MVEESLVPSAPLGEIPNVFGQFGLIKPHLWTLIRSTLVGYFVSVIPGHGATISAVVSYTVQKRISKSSDTFGSGNPEGVVASETGANASVAGALAPMLALGIPGSASTAVLIGALTLHGLQPGPLLFVRNPEIPYSIFISMIVAMPLMVVVGLGGVSLWVRVTRIPKNVIAPIVTGLCLLGSYASENDVSAVWITIIFGIIGYVLKKIEIEPAPIVLALVLGDLTETNFRRALLSAAGDPRVFLSSPMGVICFLLAIGVFMLPFIKRARKMDTATKGAVPH
jgi:putative tricarboxylic transport membrane protein